MSHGGSDVPAVVDTVFADTGVEDGVAYRYRVGAVLGNEHPVWHWSEPGRGRDVRYVGWHRERLRRQRRGRRRAGPRLVAGRQSERLTQLRFGDLGNGHPVGEEFAEALRLAHDDLGVVAVRAHAILHDDNGVVTRADDGGLAFDFTVVDELYDRILASASTPSSSSASCRRRSRADPEETVFEYRGIISPPRDWSEWHETVSRLACAPGRALRHRRGRRLGLRGVERAQPRGVLDRHAGRLPPVVRRGRARPEGRRRAARWSADRRPRRRSGSRRSRRTREKHALPLEIATTHTYGNLPLDFRGVLERPRFRRRRHPLDRVGRRVDPLRPDPRRCRGRAVRAERHAERPAPDEGSGLLGRQRPLRGAGAATAAVPRRIRPAHPRQPAQAALLGPRTSPRTWATTVLPTQVTGDGADVLVRSWASRTTSGPGTVDVLALERHRQRRPRAGRPAAGPRGRASPSPAWPTATYAVELARIDEQHSNIRSVPERRRLAGRRAVAAPARGGPPEHRTDRRPFPRFRARRTVTVTLPQPGVVRIRLVDGDPTPPGN